MPIPEEMTDRIHSSKIADLAQHDWVRWGGGLFAGAFLREFTDGLPWAHLDIAGPGFNSGGQWGHVTSGGTGFARGDPGRLRPDPGLSADCGTSCPAASGGGCSPASAAGSPTTAASYDGTWWLLQNLCAHSTDGTRRRVHSPSCATSSRVTSLTAVRGSTNPSTPRRLTTKSWRYVSSRGRRPAPGWSPCGRRPLRGDACGDASHDGSGRTMPWHQCALSLLTGRPRPVWTRSAEVQGWSATLPTGLPRKDQRGRRRLRRTHPRCGIGRLRLCPARRPARPVRSDWWRRARSAAPACTWAASRPRPCCTRPRSRTSARVGAVRRRSRPSRASTWPA